MAAVQRGLGFLEAMTHEHANTSAVRTRRFPLLGAILLASSLPDGTFAGDLTVHVEGFANDLGRAVVEVYASSTAYQNTAPEQILIAPIVARNATVTLKGFDGEYAIRAYHDRNTSGALEALTPGIALERLGYSQGAWSEIVRPDWVLASFSSDIEPHVQLIRLRTNAFVAFAQMIAVGLPALLAVFAGLGLVRWLRGVDQTQTTIGDTSHD